MDLVLLEDGAHGVVAADHAFVIWVLEVVFADVGPYSFDRLGARQLLGTISLCSPEREKGPYWESAWLTKD